MAHFTKVSISKFESSASRVSRNPKKARLFQNTAVAGQQTNAHKLGSGFSTQGDYAIRCREQKLATKFQSG